MREVDNEDGKEEQDVTRETQRGGGVVEGGGGVRGQTADQLNRVLVELRGRESLQQESLYPRVIIPEHGPYVGL